MELKIAIECNDVKKVKELISSGIHINAQDSEGMTPLMWATQAQQPEMVTLLMELGADPKIKDNKGYDALAIACWNGEYRMGAYTRECKRIIDTFKRFGVRL